MAGGEQRVNADTGGGPDLSDLKVEPVDDAAGPDMEANTAAAGGAAAADEPGWRQKRANMSLAEANASMRVPPVDAPWYRQYAAYIGVGFIISVGYMDPGNWATDLQGGASYGYRLIIIILLSTLVAMYLQYLALKLGIASERDLAQAARDAYHPKVVWGLWLVAEAAIAATDLAEVIGSAVALHLLFHIPIWAGVLITGADVFIIILFGIRSFRVLEVLIMALCAVIAGCLAYELGVAEPDWAEVASGLIPRPSILTDGGMLYAALGILGATVMPHNIYLHSSIVQTRAYQRTPEGKRVAVRYAGIDSHISMVIAFFVNAAILIMASAVFHYRAGASSSVADITTAYKLLEPALGSQVAPKIFAVGLLASGTLAGQVVMEGFLNMRMPPWARRLVTRCVAIVPAVAVAAAVGNAGVGKLLVLSQVILSLALPFAVIPLVHFTSSAAKMGTFVNEWPSKTIGCALAAIIAGLNVYLVVVCFQQNQFGAASQA